MSACSSCRRGGAADAAVGLACCLITRCVWCVGADVSRCVSNLGGDVRWGLKATAACDRAAPVSLERPVMRTHSRQCERLDCWFMAVSPLARLARPVQSQCCASDAVWTCMSRYIFNSADWHQPEVQREHHNSMLGVMLGHGRMRCKPWTWRGTS